MDSTSLRQLIKESIQEYIREVESSGNIAAQEAKIRACEEAIALREKKANMEGLDEAYHDMLDKNKIGELHFDNICPDLLEKPKPKPVPVDTCKNQIRN